MSADSAHATEEIPHVHDQATEVAHAWEHFWENVRFFACFFSVVLLTVIAWSINFGPTWNWVAVAVCAAARSLLIAYFMSTLFKQFSFVTWTFIFGAVFLIGMIFLSMWDSELKHFGNPIRDKNVPAPTSYS